MGSKPVCAARHCGKCGVVITHGRGGGQWHWTGSAVVSVVSIALLLMGLAFYAGLRIGVGDGQESAREAAADPVEMPLVTSAAPAPAPALSLVPEPEPEPSATTPPFSASRGRITVAGKTYAGNSLSIINGEVIVDGEVVGQDGLTGNVHVHVEGELMNLTTGGSVTCESVTGEVDAGTSVVVKGDVGGDIDAGTSVNVGGSVSGEVDAGGSVNIGRE